MRSSTEMRQAFDFWRAFGQKIEADLKQGSFVVCIPVPIKLWLTPAKRH